MTRRSSPVSNAMPKDPRVVACELPADLWRRFDAEAERQGFTKGALLRALILDFLHLQSVAEGALRVSEPASKQPG